METANETIAQEALRLLMSVPADDFIEGDFTDGVGKCCSLGHYQRLKNNPADYSLLNCDDHGNSDIRNLSRKFNSEIHGRGFDIADVNNDPEYNGYTQPEIKDRVIALLEDMVKAGY
jgi:hypothetical protein